MSEAEKLLIEAIDVKQWHVTFDKLTALARKTGAAVPGGIGAWFTADSLAEAEQIVRELDAAQPDLGARLIPDDRRPTLEHALGRSAAQTADRSDTPEAE